MHTRETHLLHEPLDGAAGNPDPVDVVEVVPHLVRSVGDEVLLVDPRDHRPQFRVANRSRRWRPAPRRVVGRRGDPDAVLTQDVTDRLDPEPVTMTIDEHH